MIISLLEIGERLRLAREEKGYSVSDVEGITGYSKSKIWRIEREGTRDLLTVADLCDTYGVDIRIVLFGEMAANNVPQKIKDYIIELGRYYSDGS